LGLLWPLYLFEVSGLLSEIFERKAPEDYILIYTIEKSGLKKKKSFWFQDPEEAEQFGMDQADDADVYFGLGLSPKNYGLHNRCLKKDISGITCLWIDVDIAHATHQKGNLAPTWDAAYNLVFEEPYPSFIVNSGGGIHAYWILDRKYFPNEIGEKVKKWQQSFAGRYEIDAAHDLSRILRVPDTYNHKMLDTPREVSVHTETGGVYSLDFLMSSILKKRINLLCENDPEFSDSWNHEKKMKDNSQSSYDMSIGRRLKDASFCIEDVKEAITWNRQLFSPKNPKNDMKDYLKRTVTKLWNNQADDKPIQEIPNDQKISKIMKTNSSQPVYYIHYNDGKELKINGADVLISFRKYSIEYFKKFDQIPEKMKQIDWEIFLNCQPDHEIIDTGEESTDVGALRGMLNEFFYQASKVEKSEGESAEQIIEEPRGSFWIPSHHFRKWLQDHAFRLDNQKYSVLMSEMGMKSKMMRLSNKRRFTVWGPFGGVEE